MGCGSSLGSDVRSSCLVSYACCVTNCHCTRSINKTAPGSGSDGLDALALSAFSLSAILNPASLEIPINEREVYVLIKNWKGVQSQMVNAGKIMFLRMFETNPKVQAAFEQFRNLETPSEIWKSTVLETHGMVVMNTVDEIICNLDDPQSVIEMTLAQGRAHARFGDLSHDLFWVAEDAFMCAIADVLGDHLPFHIDIMYRKVIHFIIKLLVSGFKQGCRDSGSKLYQSGSSFFGGP